MYAVNAPAHPTSPTTPQASVASMIMPQNPSIGRLPVHSVASMISYAEIKNEARNNPPYIQIPAAAAASVEAEGELAQIAPASTGRISSFPVLFLAQLLGQGMDEQTQSLVVSYETMQVFGDVKYKPSNATKPQPGNPANEFLKALAETAGSAAAKQPAPVQVAVVAKQEQPAPSTQQSRLSALVAPNRVVAARAYAAAVQNTEELESAPEEETEPALLIS